MNVKQAILFAENRLKIKNQNDLIAQNNSSYSDPRVDAEFLLAKVLGKSFTWLKTWPEFELSNEQDSLYLSLIQRRFDGEPIAYILGEKSFWTLDLFTNQSTLIPRADTEVLVESALAFLLSINNAKVLDLGTGTGAVALAIASERVNDQVFACDFNRDAIVLAKNNAIRNQIKNVELFESNWFSSVKQKQFDLIVSNPPYIEANDPHLTQGDLVFEPASALVSGVDGLDDITIIIQQSRDYLYAGGCLMLEHGYNQASRVQQLFIKNGFVEVKTIKDLASNDRVTIGLFKN